MNEQECLSKMVPPGIRRQGPWRGGVLQIHITRACDRACFGCTQGSNLGGKPVIISLEDFEKACLSLKGYFGVVGIFGGNPCIHPRFPEICLILRRHFARDQCGLWSNNLLGHGRVCRVTFKPEISNLNVHQDRKAYDEIVRDWPEASRVISGITGDSRHSPPYVAMQDVIPDEGRRWTLISSCDINQFWSAMVCFVPGRGLRAFFCEIAGAQAMLHADDPAWPDYGVEAVEGWWKKPMQDFRDQVRFYCHRCGVPLRRFGQLSNASAPDAHEEVSTTHRGIYKPKVPGRRVELVTVESDKDRHLRRAISYIENGNLK
jgi:hypothetical protein